MFHPPMQPNTIKYVQTPGGRTRVIGDLYSSRGSLYSSRGSDLYASQGGRQHGFSFFPDSDERPAPKAPEAQSTPLLQTPEKQRQSPAKDERPGSKRNSLAQVTPPQAKQTMGSIDAEAEDRVTAVVAIEAQPTNIKAPDMTPEDHSMEQPVVATVSTEPPATRANAPEMSFEVYNEASDFTAEKAQDLLSTSVLKPVMNDDSIRTSEPESVADIVRAALEEELATILAPQPEPETSEGSANERHESTADPPAEDTKGRESSVSVAVVQAVDEISTTVAVAVETAEKSKAALQISIAAASAATEELSKTLSQNSSVISPDSIAAMSEDECGMPTPSPLNSNSSGTKPDSVLGTTKEAPAQQDRGAKLLESHLSASNNGEMQLKKAGSSGFSSPKPGPPRVLSHKPMSPQAAVGSHAAFESIKQPAAEAGILSFQSVQQRDTGLAQPDTSGTVGLVKPDFSGAAAQPLLTSSGMQEGQLHQKETPDANPSAGFWRFLFRCVMAVTFLGMVLMAAQLLESSVPSSCAEMAAGTVKRGARDTVTFTQLQSAQSWEWMTVSF